MRIRKRRPPEVDHSISLQPWSSFATAGNLQRNDRNERLEIGSAGFQRATKSAGGEAAALSLVLLAAETVPHAAQEFMKWQSYYHPEAGVPFSNKLYKADSVSRTEKLDKASNKGVSGKSTVDKDRSVQEDSVSVHESGSYITSSSEVFPDFKGRIQKSRGAKEYSDAGGGRVSSSSNGVVPPRIEKEVSSALESSAQVDDLGTRCTRVDGRSWQCRRRSLPGFSLCEHHHLQLSRQSRRQRNFQRAFNQSSRKRLLKRQDNADVKGEAREGNRISTVLSGRRKSRSLEAIAQRSVEQVSSIDSVSSVR